MHSVADVVQIFTTSSWMLYGPCGFYDWCGYKSIESRNKKQGVQERDPYHFCVALESLPCRRRSLPPRPHLGRCGHDPPRSRPEAAPWPLQWPPFHS